MLAVGVVDLDHREGELAVLGQLAYAVYAAGGLLAAAYDIPAQLGEVGAHGLQQVAAVVDYDVGTVGEDVLDVAEVLLLARAVDGVDFHPAGGERRGDVVLRGERVGAGDVHLGASGGQHAAEICGLGLQVHGEGDLHAGKGLFPGKVRLDAAQHGHVAAHPGYLGLARRGEGYVAYFVHRLVPLYKM